MGATSGVAVAVAVAVVARRPGTVPLDPVVVVVADKVGIAPPVVRLDLWQPPQQARTVTLAHPPLEGRAARAAIPLGTPSAAMAQVAVRGAIMAQSVAALPRQVAWPALAGPEERQEPRSGLSMGVTCS